MNLSGAHVSDEVRETRDIVLPNQHEDIGHIAVDIGGSLAKVVYFTTHTPSSPNGRGGGRLNFVKFETEKIKDCIEFIKNLLIEDVNNEVMDDGLLKDEIECVIKATGGGAFKFQTLFEDELSKIGVRVTIQKEDEMECLVRGLNFFVREVPYEVFTYSEQDPMCFQEIPKDPYPYLVVNIGSGVSIIKVSGNDKFERISGTSLGGGTLWGLLSLITPAQTFDEMLELSKTGDNRNVDMLVGDIYGADYNKIGLKSTTIASSFGKVFKKPPQERKGAFRPEDMARSLLYMVCNNIGQIAYLCAKQHNLQRIYFGGCFIRGHPISMNSLSYGINFWSQGTIKALFLRHEGYLGAVGAFLKRQPIRFSRNSYSENFTHTEKIADTSLNAYGALDAVPSKLVPFHLLSSIDSYHPDTFDLTNPDLRRYWLDLLESKIPRLVELAIEWNSDEPNVANRAHEFESIFRDHIKRLRDQPQMYGALSVRSLLNLREQCLHDTGFTDLFKKVKEAENDAAIKNLPQLLKDLDEIKDEQVLVKVLIENMLAGNVFDWGSTQVLEMLTAGKLSFEIARSKIGRPPQYDQTPALFERLLNGPIHEKCVIFVDNAGADVILGVLPFVRWLLKRGTSVVLAANSKPAINDITYYELNEILSRIRVFDTIIQTSLDEETLLVLASGSSSSCLDLRRVNEELVLTCLTADLVLLEGMGRAIHTNFSAKFDCDTIKLAVFKNELTAKSLGARMYDGIVLFEPKKDGSTVRKLNLKLGSNLKSM